MHRRPEQLSTTLARVSDPLPRHLARQATVTELARPLR